MPEFSSFAPDPETVRGEPNHHLVDLSLSKVNYWVHFGFGGGQHLHVKVDNADFWFESVMLVGDSIFAVDQEPEFIAVEAEVHDKGTTWQIGTLATNVRVLYWTRFGQPGLMIKI